MSKVLVVDDEQDYRDLLTLHLLREGYEVKTAATGQEAIAVGIHYRPAVLVADWLLKNHIHGLCVAEVLQTVTPELRTIVITGFSSQDLQAEVDKLHVHAFVEKPFDLDDFLLTVERVARAEHPPSPLLPLAVMEIDAAGVISYANTPARELFGRTATGQQVTHIADVLECDVHALLSQAMEQWLEVRSLTPESLRWLLRIRPLVEAGHFLLVIVPGDVPHFTSDPITRMLLDLPGPSSQRWPFHGPALIIDDYEMHRRLTMYLLELVGCICHTAGTYTEGVHLFARDPTISVVVIADNAYESRSSALRQLVETLRAMRPEVPIVGTSVENRRHVFAAVGVTAFLFKPWKAEELITVLT